MTIFTQKGITSLKKNKTLKFALCPLKYFHVFGMYAPNIFGKNIQCMLEF